MTKQLIQMVYLLWKTSNLLSLNDIIPHLIIFNVLGTWPIESQLAGKCHLKFLGCYMIPITLLEVYPAWIVGKFQDSLYIKLAVKVRNVRCKISAYRLQVLQTPFNYRWSCKYLLFKEDSNLWNQISDTFVKRSFLFTSKVKSNSGWSPRQELSFSSSRTLDKLSCT